MKLALISTSDKSQLPASSAITSPTPDKRIIPPYAPPAPVIKIIDPAVIRGASKNFLSVEIFIQPKNEKMAASAIAIFGSPKNVRVWNKVLLVKDS